MVAFCLKKKEKKKKERAMEKLWPQHRLHELFVRMISTPIKPNGLNGP
jgi:hypothetical protein